MRDQWPCVHGPNAHLHEITIHINTLGLAQAHPNNMQFNLCSHIDLRPLSKFLRVTYSQPPTCPTSACRKKFSEGKQAHVGMEASKTNQTRWKSPQHFHTIPTSCAILLPLTQICYVFVSCVQRRVVEGGGWVVHFDTHSLGQSFLSFFLHSRMQIFCGIVSSYRSILLSRNWWCFWPSAVLLLTPNQFKLVISNYCPPTMFRWREPFQYIFLWWVSPHLTNPTGP